MPEKKKLMLLGSARYLLPVLKAAKELDIYTITCDYLPDGFAHEYSDEYCNVSIIDKDAVLAAAQKLEIDGIMSFACDPGVVTAAYVAEKMGLPSCGPYESVQILQNKGRFRKFLTENGFEVPVAKSYTDVQEALEDTACFQWPVIVKPSDSAGSKGVSRVDIPADLEKSIRFALQFSHCNEFIIEEFIEKRGFSSDSDSFTVDGELKFVSFSSQRFDDKAENPYTPSAYSWPASISLENQKALTKEIQRLLKLLNMRTSIYNIEVRESINNKAYIMELSPRGGGNRLAEVLRYATGIDLITNAVKAAVGMDIEGMEQKSYNGSWAEVILHGDKAGVFRKLWISPEIIHNVYEEDLWIQPGDKVGSFTGANEAVGTLLLKFESDARLQEVMADIHRYVKIEVEKK